MKDKVCFKSDTSAQILILTGFVIAVIIVGMGTVLYSVANSGQQTSILQSDRAYNNFENIREEYGIALMASSEKGEIDPFNVSNTTIILEFEDRMKTIVESHGFILNFTNHEPILEKNRAVVDIFFTDGKKEFNDSVTYNLLTGKIIYDTIPPGNITDLKAGPYPWCDGDGVVWLNWTAVGDDGYDEDTSANKYEVRYSNSSIDSLADFEDAIPWGFLYGALKNGSEENRFVYDIDPGNWYFAVRVYDEAGNPSNISNTDDAEPSGWSPEIYNITNISGTPITETNPVLPVLSGDNVTIKFNVTDKDEDNVSIILMVRNNTDWYEGTNWTNQNSTWYNNESYYYTISDNISKNWDFYINVTDNDAPCFRNKSSPEDAPDSYYSINLTDYTPPKTIAINSTYVNDTYIILDDSSNYGHLTDIHIQNAPKPIYGLIKFNLSSINSSANIISANISLFVHSSQGNMFYFHKINSSWEEDIVNGTDMPSYESTVSSSGVPIKDQYTNWSVTTDVEDFNMNPENNHGWQIKIDKNQVELFYSKDAALNSPILYVTYYE